MKFAYKPLVLALTGLSLSGIAIADDATTTNLGTLTVTADSRAAINNPNQREVVITNNSNAMRNASLVNDFLNEVPGVSIGGTSAMDQHIYIRGVDDKSLKVTVDGARQEGWFFHHAGSTTIDPMFLKRAEVYVGNNSVTLGNNAKGGAVAFTTVDAADLLKDGQRLGASIKLGYGSNDSEFAKVASVYGKPTSNTDFLLAYGHRESDGGEDARGNHIKGDNIEAQNIMAKFSFLPSPAHKLSLGYKQLENTGNYPFRPEFGYSGTANRGQIYPAYNNSTEYTVNYTYNPSEKLKAEVGAYHTEREFQVQGYRNGRKMSINYDGEVNGVNAKVRQLLNIKNSSHQLIYGLEAYEKSTVSSSGTTPEQKATSYGAYLEDKMTFGKVSITPGVRFDQYEAGRLYGDEKFDKVSGAIAGSIKLTDNVEAFASYTEIFNGPPSPESIGNGATPYVNQNLKPETGNNTEYGLSAHYRGVYNANDSVRLTAKGFRTNLEDIIASQSGVDCSTGQVVHGGSCTTYINSGDTLIKGYELSAGYDTNDFGVKASYEHARSKHSVPSTSTRLTPKDAGDRLALSATYYGSSYEVSSRFNHISGFTRGTTRLKGYETWDIFGTFKPKFAPSLTLDAGIYNLTDKYYANHSSQNADYDMGRNFKVSATYKF